MGRLLAKIHEIGFNEQGFIYPDKIDDRFTFNESGNYDFEKHLKRLLDSKKIEADAARKYEIKFKDLFHESNEAKLCHGDYSEYHVILDGHEKPKVSGIVDWEFARSAEPAADLAKTEIKMNIFSNNPGNFNHVKEGYRDAGKLPDNYNQIKKGYQLLKLVGLMTFFNDKELISDLKGKCDSI